MEGCDLMSTNKTVIIEELRNSQIPVVLCGAGIVGELLLNICSEEGITVDCVCDNSEKVAGSMFHGLEVILTREFKEKYDDALFLISVAAIRDAVELLQNQGFTRWFAGGVLLEGFDISQNNPDASLDYTRFAVENCIICHHGYLNPDKLFLRSVDLIITERCSLKCRDCSNLMQYYVKPQDCDLSTLLKSVDRLFTIVDEIMDFRIIGGDAFMNREWPEIVKRVRYEPKAKRVVLYTNGTIVPDDDSLETLRGDKTLVIITDYGVLSRNLAPLKIQLKRMGIAYHVLQIAEWLDCAGITPHDRTAAQNRQLYRSCCAKNMLTLSNGRLFRCPYSANAARLAAVPDYHSDYIDLFQELDDGTGIQVTRDKLRDFLSNLDYLLTCDFCSGRPLSGIELLPAIQSQDSLPYRNYSVNPFG